jgi:hypothetical protein
MRGLELDGSRATDAGPRESVEDRPAGGVSRRIESPNDRLGGLASRLNDRLGGLASRLNDRLGGLASRLNDREGESLDRKLRSPDDELSRELELPRAEESLDRLMLLELPERPDSPDEERIELRLLERSPESDDERFGAASTSSGATSAATTRAEKTIRQRRPMEAMKEESIMVSPCRLDEGAQYPPADKDCSKRASCRIPARTLDGKPSYGENLRLRWRTKGQRGCHGANPRICRQFDGRCCRDDDTLDRPSDRTLVPAGIGYRDGLPPGRWAAGVGAGTSSSTGRSTKRNPPASARSAPANRSADLSWVVKMSAARRPWLSERR